MPVGIAPNPYLTAQTFPNAAEKGGMDQRQLEKRANAQVESRPPDETTAVPSRRKPVQAKSDDARAQLHSDERQQRLSGEAKAQVEQKGGRISIYV